MDREIRRAVPAVPPVKPRQLDLLVFLAKVAVIAAACFALAAALHFTDLLTLLFVTLLCLQPTVLGGIRAGLQQVAVAAAGSLGTALIMLLVPAPVALLLGLLAITAALYTRSALLPIGWFAVLYIGILGRTETEAHLAERFAHFIVGIPLATLVNYVAGAYNYRRRLYHRLRQERAASFAAAATLLDAFATRDHARCEAALAPLAQRYAGLAELAEACLDIEREYASPLGLLRRNRIRDIRQHLFYAWHLRDLLQHCHTLTTLVFRVAVPDPCAARAAHLAALLRAAAYAPLPAAVPLPPPAADRHDPQHLMLYGTLAATDALLASVRQLEVLLPELAGQLTATGAGATLAPSGGAP